MKTINANRLQQSSTAEDAWRSRVILPARVYDDPTIYATLTSGLVEQREKHVRESSESSLEVANKLRASYQEFIGSLVSLESAIQGLNEKTETVINLRLEGKYFDAVMTDSRKLAVRGEAIRLFGENGVRTREIIGQEGDSNCGKALCERLAKLVKSCAPAQKEKVFLSQFRQVLTAAIKDGQTSYKELLRAELQNARQFEDAARVLGGFSEYLFLRGALDIAERASKCVRELSAMGSPDRVRETIATLTGVLEDAKVFSCELLESGEHPIALVEATLVERMTARKREKVAHALSKELEERLANVGAHVGKISDSATLLAAMDFHLSRENVRSFENLAQRFLKGTTAERAKSLGDLDRTLTPYLPECPEHEVAERASRLKALLTRAASIGVRGALDEEQATSRRRQAEYENQDSPETKAELAVLARFVENEDVQRRLHTSLSETELGVELLVKDVEEQLAKIVGEEIALELLRENPLIVEHAILAPEEFHGYLDLLMKVAPVISATRAEHTYSPRLFRSTKSIHALIESEGAELGSGVEHPDADIVRDLESAGVSSPQLAYAILRFGFMGSDEFAAGAYLPEETRFNRLYDGIEGPIPAKELIQAQEAELTQLGVLTFGPKRSATLVENTKASKDLRTALWKMQSKRSTTDTLTIRVER